MLLNLLSRICRIESNTANGEKNLGDVKAFIRQDAYARFLSFSTSPLLDVDYK